MNRYADTMRMSGREQTIGDKISNGTSVEPRPARNSPHDGTLYHVTQKPIDYVKTRWTK